LLTGAGGRSLRLLLAPRRPVTPDWRKFAERAIFRRAGQGDAAL